MAEHGNICPIRISIYITKHLERGGTIVKLRGRSRTLLFMISICLLITLSVLAPPLVHADAVKTILMGTGSENGVYYNLGKALAKQINKDLASKGYYIKVVTTKGSAENLKGLRDGKFALALVQSDIACKAYKGTGQWCNNRKCEGLRSIASLMGESVNLICADGSNIQAPRDLTGKRIAIGSKGSGTRGNALDVLKMYGVSTKDVTIVECSSPDKVAELFVRGEIDAFFMTMGHPNLLIYRVSNTVPTRFIALKSDVAKRAGIPYYIEVLVPAKHYPKAKFPKDFLPTLGVRAVLVATKSLPDSVASSTAEELYGNWVMLPDIHFGMYGITPNKMQETLCAPLHPKVKKYIKEKGH